MTNYRPASSIVGILALGVAANQVSTRWHQTHPGDSLLGHRFVVAEGLAVSLLDFLQE